MIGAPRPRRVLLVDDEPRIVEGLKRALRPHRAAWDVATATSGALALELLEAAPFDVLVTDMRMPELDGADLLARARDRYPAMIRVVLSGQTDAAAALRAVPVAHRFVSKPTDPLALLQSLGRALATAEAIGDDRMLVAVGGLAALPSPLASRHDLDQVLSLTAGSMAAVAALIEQDPAVVLKLLQVVGSGYFCLPCATCNVAEAIAHLGLEPLRSVIMSVNVHNGLPPAASLDLAAFQAHAFAVARTARLVAGGPGEPGDEAFVAGLLHDVGRLALANAPPELKGSEVPCVLAGGEGAVDHAKVGAYVADLWGLPGAVVAALSEQRCVRDLDHQAVAASDAVYAAHLLLGSSELDEAERAYLARVGLLDRWASLAATASAYAGTS